MALSRIADSRNRQRGKDDVIQEFGTVYSVPIGLGENVRAASTNALNQLLADTMVLRDLYKKHHWQVSGATFYQLHLLFDKHYAEQVELMDGLAERITSLGGVPLAAPHDVAEASSIRRPPKGRESVPAQISRLLDAHEQILIESRGAAKEASQNGDDGTNDLIVSDVIRTNEMHVFFLSEHLADGDPHGHQKSGVRRYRGTGVGSLQNIDRRQGEAAPISADILNITAKEPKHGAFQTPARPDSGEAHRSRGENPRRHHHSRYCKGKADRGRGARRRPRRA